MKTITLFALGMAVGVQVQSQSLNEPSDATALPAPASAAAIPLRYEEGERGANHKVWNKVTEETDADGKVILTTNQAYVELANGKHYRENGQWAETKEEFELVPGWATAYKGPHKVALAYNLNTRGSVAITMPDGQTMRSHVIGLYYIDPGTGQNVFITEVNDCVGKVVEVNQVLYENAFNGLKADVRYDYSKSGIEQDIILRQQPPNPAKYGLNPATTRLVVLTEFLDMPEATVIGRGLTDTLAATQSKGGDEAAELEDQEVSFGPMRIVRGKSFKLGADAYDDPARNPAMKRVPVVKRWLVQDGRTFLYEEVPLSAAQEELSRLPEQASIRSRHSRSLLAGLEIPKQRLAERPSNKTMQMARSLPREPGYVMDYFLVNVNTNDFTFRGDTTYFVSANVTISGKITLEGGTVIKFSPTNSAEIYAANGNFDCKTMPFCPATLTASSDDTIGELITGSTGVPTNYLTGFEVHGSGTPVFNHMAVRYAVYGLSVYTSAASLVNDVQFVKCDVPLDFHYNLAQVRNCLFDRVGIPFAGIGYQYSVENATINDCSAQFSHSWSGVGSITMTNCIAVGLTNWGNASGILTNNSVASLTPMPSLFQSVAAGNFYLASNSSYRNVGWTNINSTLLSELGKKTTYPPIIYSNVTFWADTTFTPQASRDTDTPDLGYHYNPIDYLIDQVAFSNSVVVLTNGVVIGCLDDNGMLFKDGSAIQSIGTPLNPNWFVLYKAAQEQPIKVGSYFASFAFPFQTNLATVINGDYAFTKFVTVASGNQYVLYHSGNWSYDSLQIRNCEFWNGLSEFGGSTNTIASLVNNLFRRSTARANGTAGVTTSLAFSNNSSVYGVVRFVPAGCSNCWSVFNNAFDGAGGIAVQYATDNGYNAYYNSTFRFYPTNVTDIVSTNNLTYESGRLGDYYQPTNSPLLNVGSTNAQLLGLYHYTTTTNQVKETSTVVDIGYHYMALDASGSLVDTDGDGIPDYLEDVNGNGAYDAGTDINNWQSADSDGDGRIDDYFKVLILSPR